MELRIGINTGDVIVDDHDIYGNSVNIAARLEGLAEPGEVYVTRSVRDQLQGQPSLLLEACLSGCHPTTPDVGEKAR
jgi:class 3 adenylate cyclase